MLLATLIAIYLRLNVGKSIVPLSERLAVQMPFSVYLGWITIASIANVAVALVSVVWDGFGISQETWAILIMIIAMLITLLIIATRKDLTYGLVIIWALLGIAIKQNEKQNIVTTTAISAAIIVIALIWVFIISRLKK